MSLKQSQRAHIALLGSDPAVPEEGLPRGKQQLKRC
jgi:hypothetical protein